MITLINEWKTLKSIYHTNVNVDLIEENVIQINSWNNDKCRCEYKNAMYMKKIMFGILLHVIVKMENI